MVIYVFHYEDIQQHLISIKLVIRHCDNPLASYKYKVYER